MKRIIPLIFLLLAGYMAVRAQISGQAEVNVNDLSFSKQYGYDVIRWNGGDEKIQQAGAPELPVILKTYVVPLEGLSIKSHGCKWQLYALSRTTTYSHNRKTG